MSLVNKILEELLNIDISYRGVRNRFHSNLLFENHSYGSVQSTLSRLSKGGYIMSENKKWKLTKLGKDYIQKNKLKIFNFKNIDKNAPKNLLVMFDIPEERKREREWFRRHLTKLNYIMIQKSVWVGPSPLPKEFTDYTKKIKLQDTIKTFKLAKGYPIK